MKLSIITATFNCGSILSKCLDSVASQDALKHIEHIIVDGASSDNTLNVASSYSHIRQIYSSPDRGIYHAFNRGVDLATGDLIYFLGADDSLYDNSTISAVLSSFDSEDIDYLTTRVRCFNSETGEDWIVQAYSKENVNLCHQGFFCRKTLFEKIGPFNECLRLCADTFFMQSAIKNYKGKSLNLISANFRQGGASSLESNRLRLRREMKVINALQGDEVASVEHQLDQNVTDLKLLFEKSISRGQLIPKYRGKRIAIFGTRQLSLSVAQLLLNIGAHIECFVVSYDVEHYCVMNIPVISISSLKNVGCTLVITCVEGMHESKVAEDMKLNYRNLKVISWRNL